MKLHNHDTGYASAIAAANSFDGLQVENGASLEPGELYAANSSRFVQAYYQEPLTQYAVGWSDEQNLDALLEFIAPSVQVPHRFEYAEFPNAEAFSSDANGEDDLRNIGGEFKSIRYSSTKTEARTYNRGLTMRVDVEEIEGMPNWREHFTGQLMQRLKRNAARKAWAMAVAAATNAAKTWDTSSLKDPDQDVLTARLLYRDGAGVMPNRALYTDGAWNKRGISHRAQNTAGGFASAQLSPVEAKSLLMMDVMVSDGIYQSSAATKLGLQGTTSDYVVLFKANAGVSRNDPSNFKNFWSACPQSGQRYAVYVQPFGVKFWDITVEHYNKLTPTSTVGVRLLTVS